MRHPVQWIVVQALKRYSLQKEKKKLKKYISDQFSNSPIF